MGEKFRKVIMGLVVILLSYLLVANIIHVIVLNNEKEEMFLIKDTSTVKVLKNDYQKLEANLKRLKTIKKTKHLDEKKYQEILEIIEQDYKKIADSSFIDFEFGKVYKNREIYDLAVECDSFGKLSFINVYRIVIESDPNSGFDYDRVVSDYLTIAFNMSNIENKFINNYRYFTLNNKAFGANGTEVASIYSNATKKITNITVLSDYLVKDGGLSE